MAAKARPPAKRRTAAKRKAGKPAAEFSMAASVRRIAKALDALAPELERTYRRSKNKRCIKRCVAAFKACEAACPESPPIVTTPIDIPNSPSGGNGIADISCLMRCLADVRDCLAAC